MRWSYFRKPGANSPEVWHRLIERLEAAGAVTESHVELSLAELTNSDAAWMIREAFGQCTITTGQELARLMAVVDYYESLRPRPPEIIWTGPANGCFPVRRIDQVLYDLIAASKRRIMIVTFAAQSIDHLCSHLTAAISRGVTCTMILESGTESEGQLTRDASGAFRQLGAQPYRVLIWPREKRQRNARNKPGKLHAKCAVVDDSTVISSANLTDDAFKRNIELGIVLEDQAISNQVARHFEELQRVGILQEAHLEA